MKEKLVIKNFGPIKSVELELGRFNVLIGEQGTGKSLVAKLLYVLLQRNFLFGTQSQRNKIFEDARLPITEKTVVEFFGDVFNISGIGFVFNVLIKGEKSNQIEAYKNVYQKLFSDTNSEDLTLLREELYLLDKQYSTIAKTGKYIPAERMMYGSLNFSRSSNKFLYDFQVYYNASKTLLNSFKMPHLGNTEYVFEKDSIQPDKVIINNEKMDIDLTSSGFQSSIPLVIFVESEYRETSKSLILVEEPELNLFPKTQNSLVQYLVAKTISGNDSMLLTTHSPYTLTSLNNMMYAWQIGQNHSEEVGAIMEKKYWISPEEVSAYMMLSDGTCENILDRKEGMIDAEKIDGISGELNKQFDQLIEIEHNDIAQ